MKLVVMTGAAEQPFLFSVLRRANLPGSVQLQTYKTGPVKPQICRGYEPRGRILRLYRPCRIVTITLLHIRSQNAAVQMKLNLNRLTCSDPLSEQHHQSILIYFALSSTGTA